MSVFHDGTNAAVRGTKTKRSGRFQLLPLSLSVTSVLSKSLASSRKSPATCRVSFEHATSLSSCITEDVNMVPFPSSEDPVDSELDIDCRPHKLRRCSEHGPTPNPQKRRRSARHSLLAPTATHTCRTRTRSSSFSHSRQLSVRETNDLRFTAMIRRSVLYGCSDWMDLDENYGQELRRQDTILIERLEKYLLERGYRDIYSEGEPSILFPYDATSRFDDDACISPVHAIRHTPETMPSRSQAVAALILRHRSRTGLRQRSRIDRVMSPSPLARQYSLDGDI